MKKAELLKLAIGIAIEAHKDHVDKAGVPYITHALRVMGSVKGSVAMAAAVLHDVVEDTDISFNDLLMKGVPLKVVDIVATLTRRDGESYNSYIIRAGENKIPRAIKIADLEDNMDLRRLSRIKKEDMDRLSKYLKAYRYLSDLL